jgi:hypothetical protein
MSARPIHLCLGALLVSVAGCAAPPVYDEPYALIEPGLRSATRKEAPAFIHAVDGKIPVSSRYPIPVQPGKHVIDVYFSTNSSAGPPEASHHAVDIDAAPCVRYRIVARYYGYYDLVNPRWEPVVYSEPVGECLAKFPRAGSGTLG